MSTPTEDRLLRLRDDVPGRWVSLADAARITGRTTNTILHWIATQQLGPEEARQVDATQGSGKPWSIWLPALSAVHTARGGTYWQPEAMRSGTLPPQVVEELASLRSQVATLTQERDRLRAQLEALRRPGPLHRDRDRETSPTLVRAPAALASSVSSSATLSPLSPRTPPSDLPPLPEGYISLSTVGKTHGFVGGRSSAYRQSPTFMREVITGPWWHPDGYEVLKALDEDGQRLFGSRFARSANFAPCGRPGCLVCRAAGVGVVDEEEDGVDGYGDGADGAVLDEVEAVSEDEVATLVLPAVLVPGRVRE